MEQLGDRSEKGTEDARAVEMILQTVTQDLKTLHQGLIVQLSQEVTRLQAEKNRLIADIEKLQVYHRALQSKQLESLSQQQIAQQQLWAKQLAQLLAVHLQAQIAERLNQLTTTHPTTAVSPTQATALTGANGHSESAHRLLASLDATFNSTFKTLQRELDSYQSSLSQQLSRMHNLEQQGEAILEALISRLREQLQLEASRSTAAPPPSLRETGYPSPSYPPPVEHRYPANPYPPPGIPHPPTPPSGYYPAAPDNHNVSTVGNGLSNQPLMGRSPALPEGDQRLVQGSNTASLSIPAAPLPLPAKPKKEMSNFQLGLVLVLVSTIALSLHNVVVRVLGRESLVLGWLLGDSLSIGGVIDIRILGNSLLILFARMCVVLPLMIPVALFLYPPVWRDIQKFVTASDRRPLINVIGSGFFLFLSQILIYISIGQIGPGPAVTILFMYPIVTVPLAWFLFGDRPTRLRWIVMAVILLGVILTRLGPVGTMPVSGIFTAVCAGIAFALYLIFMQLGFKKLHPIPVSLIQFSTIFVLTAVILILPLDLGTHVDPDDQGGFMVGAFILGALTLVGYLANNFGVRFMGAARASIIASSGPAMTAILALVFIQDRLGFWQWLGILLVTLGVGALSLERMKTPPQTTPKPSN